MMEIDPQLLDLFLALVRLLARRGLPFPNAVVTCNRRVGQFADRFEIDCTPIARCELTAILTEILDRPFWVHDAPWYLTEAEGQEVVRVDLRTREKRQRNIERDWAPPRVAPEDEIGD